MNDNAEKFYEFEDFRLDRFRDVLFRGDAIVDITPKAVQILKLLVERSGEAVSKEEIFAKVWPDSFVEEANLSHHIFKLRKALAGENELRLIETLPKRGYRFVGKIRETSDLPEVAIAATTRPRKWIVSAIVVVFCVALLISWLYFQSATRSVEPSSASGSPTLAVLPFVNESADDEIEYLASGLTESLIGRFSGTASLRVRPYSTVSRYKASELSLEAIGNELNVGYLLTGRITERTGTVRLFMSLVEVRTGYQIWGKQYERDAASLAMLQSEILRDVSEYLPAKVSASDQERILSPATRNNEAYVLYLKGRYQLNRKTVDGLQKAIDHFNEAVAIDPSYALAYSGIADAYNQMGLWVTMPPADTFPKARAAAEHALSLDNRLAEASAALGSAKFYYDWDFAGAEKDFQQAIRENPDYIFAREAYGVMIYESNPARFDEALRQLNTASEIDPVALSPYFWRGAFYYFEGRHDLALRELKESQSIDPNFTLGRGLQGAVYREQGDYNEYLNHWLSASPLEGVDLSVSEITQLRRVFESRGLKAYEVAYAELLQEKSKEKYVSPLFVAMHYSIAGENDLAIEWLEKAFAERSSWLVELKVDPAWKNLHADARYRAMVRRIGF